MFLRKLKKNLSDNIKPKNQPNLEGWFLGLFRFPELINDLIYGIHIAVKNSL